MKFKKIIQYFKKKKLCLKCHADIAEKSMKGYFVLDFHRVGKAASNCLSIATKHTLVHNLEALNKKKIWPQTDLLKAHRGWLLFAENALSEATVRGGLIKSAFLSVFYHL